MKNFNNNALKGTILLIGVILVAAALARFLNASQTLDDYAKSHPDEQVKEQVKVDEVAEKPSVNETSNTDEKDNVKQEEALLEEAKTEIEEKSYEEENVEKIKEDDSSFEDEYDDSSERVYVNDDFFYEPIPKAVREKMKGLSYPDDINEDEICYDDLCYLSILYKDFDGNICKGQLVCNELIARDLTEIFSDLFENDYRFENIKLIDEYGADDVLSMSDNNTSCFCYRVVDGTKKMSDHAYGMAIDINPFYNPYVVFKSGEDDYISPPGSEIYADRSENNPNPYRIDKNDLAYKLFKEHGFKWGGDWNSMKDYQHFYKKR